MKQPILFFAMAFAVACAPFGGDGVFESANESDAAAQKCVEQTFYFDGDKDTFGDPAKPFLACKDTLLPGYVANMTDCNDDAPSVHPGAPEQCDKVDNDCNKLVDDTKKSWFLDHDGDGHGDAKFTEEGTCKGAQPWLVANADDCDDNDLTRFPGNTEVGHCDQKDNDCNGKTDEGVQSTFFADVDGDGHGDSLKPVLACFPSANAVVSKDDCGDTDPSVFTGAVEICDGKDNDCNKLVDDGVKKTYFKDDDGDGYGAPDKKVEACDVPVGATTTGTDCNDDPNANPHGKKIHPGAAETCNNVDENCDGVTDEGVKTKFFVDGDGDGHGSSLATWETCNPGINPKTGDAFVASFDDCDDSDPTVHPGASEICDGKINDCKAQKLVEPDSLCPAKPFKEATCGGVNKCQYEDEKLLMTCSNPEQFKESDGYSCGVAYYFGDALVDKKIVMTFEKVASSPSMADVCGQLKVGKTLHVSVFVQLDFDAKFIWVATSYMKLIDSFTNTEIQKKNPGNVVVGDSVEFDLKLEDVPACQ